jgi:hypothetical protein
MSSSSTTFLPTLFSPCPSCACLGRQVTRRSFISCVGSAASSSCCSTSGSRSMPTALSRTSLGTGATHSSCTDSVFPACKLVADSSPFPNRSLEDLIFDGVFLLAPHPMYSVGYAGYYGISLIVASPAVLFLSMAGHAAQFGFLVWFENPRALSPFSPLPVLTATHP